ncbi:hypothetical protein HNQ71_001512 [Mesorhizobium sangaii]|uniref:Uncharacterized protein n=1 Tax=Mesorhizobium sangaii TaxID=505389 RepID=A0A841P7Q2_9HYPH|nr:hypothetical protein [Mesorhizobium sangaii]MBB6408868.1 hypothetical protein [Mesorhizobium sangaii]
MATTSLGISPTAEDSADEGSSRGDEASVRAPANIGDVAPKIFGESGDVETPHVIRLIGPPMNGRYDIDALQHCFELCGHRRTFDGVRLQAQRADQRQTVLNAVIELLEQ